MLPHGVLFDFAGTLFDDTGAVPLELFAQQLDARGRGRDLNVASRLRTAILGRAASPAGTELRLGSDRSPERHRAAWMEIARTTCGVGEQQAEAFYECLTAAQGWRPYPDTAPVLRELHAAGVPVAVVSNTGWDIRRSFEAAGVQDLVTDFVLSCEVGVEKPDRSLFLLACDRIGVAPDHAVHVGDDPRSDGPAVDAGLSVLLLAHERASMRPRGLHAALRLIGLTPRL